MDLHGNPVILLVVIISIFVATYNNPTLLMADSLARGHVEFESHCMECHSPWRGVQKQKCIDCHREDETKIDVMAHGEECKTCHLEHKGRDVRVGQFNHSRVNYEHTEDHVNLVCEDCHSYGYLKNLVPACLDCHQQSEVIGELNVSLNQEVIERACIHCHRKAEVDLEDFNIEDWL